MKQLITKALGNSLQKLRMKLILGPIFGIKTILLKYKTFIITSGTDFIPSSKSMISSMELILYVCGGSVDILTTY